LSSIEPGALGRAIAATPEDVTLRKVRDVGLANARMNAERIRTGEDILALQGTRLMEGDTALVIGAGPSLHRTNVAARLKASGFRGPIVATESAMAYCFRNGLVPDLIVTLDPHATRIVRWFGDPQLTQKALEQDDYFARRDLDPGFAADQLRTNAELIALVNQSW
jgi:hypothetical protein